MEGRRFSPALLCACLSVLFIGTAFGALLVQSSVPQGQPATAETYLVAAGKPLTREGLVLPLGPSGSWDDLQVSNPSVLVQGAGYAMWYNGCSYATGCQIGYATSADGLAWTKLGPVLVPSLPAEGAQVQYPNVLKVGDQFWMWYNGFDGSTFRILAATSPDGTTWTKLGVVLGPGPAGSDDQYAPLIPHVIAVGGVFRMYYTGFAAPQPSITKILLATSPDGVTWTRVGTVLSNGMAGSADSFGAEAPAVAAVKSAGAKTIYEMIYRGQTEAGGTSLMEAISTDGMAWRKLGVVLSPLAPNENIVGWPFILPRPDGSAYVYYAARAGGFDFQIYLAIQKHTP